MKVSFDSICGKDGKTMVRCALGLALALMLVAVVGCDNGKIEDKIISQSTSGSADDGNDNNDPPNGKTYPPGLQAKDNTTTANSDKPKFDTVGGSVKAIPAPPAGATKDAATAKSFNMVKSAFVVSSDDKFTFDVSLHIVQPKVTKNAKLTVQVRANVLDKNGVTIPGGQITDIEFKIDQDANGKTQVSPQGQQPEALDANGNYKRRLSGPSGGIPLKKDDYQIELEIRLIATASTAPGGDSATIDHATASIKLR